MSEVLIVNTPIAGMSCASCVAKVEKQLNQLEGVSATVNLAAAKAELKVPKGFDQQLILQAIEALKYKSQTDNFELYIEGMHCASCVSKVEKALLALPGVLSANVNLANEKAFVSAFAGNITAQDLIQALQGIGYKAHSSGVELADVQQQKQQEVQSLKRDIWLAALLTLPVFVLGMGEHMGLGRLIDEHLGHFYNGLVQFVFTTAVLLGPGWRFIKVGIPMLLRRSPDMNSLVALGSGAAWLFSSIVVFAGHILPENAQHYYFEAAAVIVTLILFGRLLEARAKGQTGEAVQKLLSLQEKTARVLEAGQVVEKPIESLQVGDVIIVRPGERIALDGKVIEGRSLVDESMLTGEPLAVHKQIGSEVTGGTLNNSGALTVSVSRVGKDTRLAQIISMVEQAQAAKLPIQSQLDKVTSIFVPVVMVAALLTFVVWLFFGGEQALTMALVNSVAVLIIACPCAMGLATPTSIMVGTGRAAELGILFHKGDALQSLNQSQVVAFDKTGTLTEGKPKLTDIIPLADYSEQDILTWAASVEQNSEHTLALALLEAAKNQSLVLLQAKGFAATVGHGVEALIDNKKITVGGDAMLLAKDMTEYSLSEQAQKLAKQGKTRLFVLLDDQLIAIIAVMDVLRESAVSAVAKLHSMGIKTAMISGDNQQTVQALADSLAIEAVYGGVQPEGKVERLKTLRQEYGTVAFVGDGINDAPALAEADAGIAMGSGTDVAMEAADVVLMNTNIHSVVNAFTISAATLKNIKQNLFWAFAYNAVLIPVAAGALYPFFGILLSPMLASAAMAMSSVFVVTNALRLKRLG